MSTKFFSFLAMCWFVSTLICLILEGSYFGSVENSVINNLSVLTTFNIGNLLVVPVFNVNFVNGIVKILLWDYSFYTGGFIIIRWFWLVTLTPGAIWGIIQTFMYIYSQALTLFRLF